MSVDQLALVAPAAVRVIEARRDEADALLVAWGHYLGACNRPFGLQAWVLVVDDDPVSVAVSASTVSARVAGRRRREVVELARLCSCPGQAWATRCMLRLWRSTLAARWPYWPPAMVVAYSHNDRHEGRIYRFDGWARVTGQAGSRGGGTWTRARHAGSAQLGNKTLWTYDLGAQGTAP